MEYRTRSYLQLIKPGITLSNTLSAVAGYFLAASALGFGWTSFVGLTAGVAFVIASACVANNIIDRDIDTKMKRTARREVASGKISVPTAAIFSFVLGVAGFGLLLIWTNLLTAALGALCYVWYVVIYGIAKRTTPLSTIIGAVCGALPPVAGYTALTGTIDTTAIILFAMLMVWQLPHFYAISLFRYADYKKANLPVWSVRYSTMSTRKQMVLWSLVFIAISPLLGLVGAVGNMYIVVMLAVSMWWAVASITHQSDDSSWARKMFGNSIIVLLVMLLAIGAGGYLP